MKNTTSHAYSQTRKEPERLYKILDELQVGVTVTSNPYGLELDHLFRMAARINKKRGFLFVSKLLGKHLPVQPSLSLASGAVLGCLYESMILGRESAAVSVQLLQEAFQDSEKADALYERLMDNKINVDEPTLFIGFAETATALGHSMFDAFKGNVSFLTTTREQIEHLSSLINFEEEHSHAMSHRCYALDPELFRKADRIVLVDDEITTGNTSLNIIKELFEQFGHEDYVVASLLDWRSEADRNRFAKLEQELGIRIRCLSLIEGSITIEGSPLDEQARLPASVVQDTEVTIRKLDVSRYFMHLDRPPVADNKDVSYLSNTGRFGMTAAQGELLDREIEQASKQLVAQRTGKRVICMGTGEFMYIPMRIADLMGNEVYYQSTTRSPIHPMQREQYAVSSAYKYESVDDASVANYMYNLSPGQYDEAFVFVEREYDEEKGKSFEQALARIGIPIVNLVFFSKSQSEEGM
ncbi:phosphoribosyltransferase family protein [Cohnella herbarum]|uniref:Adenine/guanine phosphoribosyltransferase n=1 Tax=Cohnella herbarum TaxID=2728023 RepID=A0A7Z2VKR7_9BACL|nr:phosphoribosyltransferase family protein [Cohnella herbarum]QJD84849.1 adenine/guanine phosphoribosyltransferase [Cohnella herbarum]